MQESPPFIDHKANMYEIGQIFNYGKLQRLIWNPHGYVQNHNVKQIWSDLKEELLKNNKITININQFNTELQKADIKYESLFKSLK